MAKTLTIRTLLSLLKMGFYTKNSNIKKTEKMYIFNLIVSLNKISRRVSSLCIVFLSIVVYGQSVPQSSQLIAYYPFLGNANDLSGNNYDGTLSGGPTLTQNRFGHSNSAYSLDGVDDYIYFGNAMYADLPDTDGDGYYEDSFSISIWAKSSVNAEEAFVAFGEELGLYTGMIARIGANISFNSSNWGIATSTSGKKSDGQWHQYVFVYVAGNSRKIFIDGSLALQSNDSQLRFSFKNYGVSIGKERFIPSGTESLDNTYTGSVDDVRVWNVALTNAEVASLFTYENDPLNATTPFVTTWQTNGSDSITIPLTGSGYDFTIDWGDGNFENKSGAPGNISHTYTSAGIKTISITPTTTSGFPRIYINNFANRNNLKTVEQWGNGQWATMERAFYGASTFDINATDSPNLSLVTNFNYMFLNCNALSNPNSSMTNWVFTTDPTKSINMANMFQSAIAFNQDISSWNTERVTNMSNLFNNAQVFNQNISGWDVSNVTNMAAMFNNAKVFNQPLNTWSFTTDPSKTINMSSMFQSAKVFNQDISAWNVERVNNMSGMFYTAQAFNQNISNWDVSNVSNMYNMFRRATVYNQPLNSWGIKTGNVTNMGEMFREASAFNQSINAWDVSSVTKTQLMFYQANSFNQDLNSWDVSSLVTPSQMFQNAASFNGDISSWPFTTDPTKSINMSSMFLNAVSFNQYIGGWNVERVNNMSNMFNNAKVFNQDINTWNVTNVTNMSGMFNSAKAFNQNINAWNVTNVTNMSSMFNNAQLYNQPLNSWTFTTDPSKSINMASMFQSTPVFNQDISNWNVERVNSMSSMFRSTKAFNINIGTWDVSNVSNMSFMFYDAKVFNQAIGSWGVKTVNVTNMQEMFRQAPVFNQDINAWDVSKVTTTRLMFYQTNSFNQDLNSWDVSSLVDPSHMFRSNTAFNGDISNWQFTTDPTKNINMSYMFNAATVFNKNIGAWNVARVNNMSNMFNDAKVFNQNINGWNVSNVTNMSSMFYNALIFNQPLNSWVFTTDPSKSINMTSMFRNTPVFNQNISNWNVERVNTMNSMFYSAQAFNQDLSNWDVSNVYNMTSMFRNTTVFDQPLNAWGIKTGNVTTMREMFWQTGAFNQDLSGWDVSSVTDMWAMFHLAGSFNQDLGAWNISSLTNADHFMTGKKLSRVNYDNILRGWETLDAGETQIPVNIVIKFGSSKYSNNSLVIASRSNLVDNKNWTITDGGTVSVLTNNGELSGSYTINVNKNGVLGISSGVSSNGEIID